jgi:hypothetical protein
MNQTIEHDAGAALMAANLGCRYVTFQALGAARLSVETPRYSDAERVLADVGLELVDLWRHSIPLVHGYPRELVEALARRRRTCRPEHCRHLDDSRDPTPNIERYGG